MLVGNPKAITIAVCEQFRFFAAFPVDRPDGVNDEFCWQVMSFRDFRFSRLAALQRSTFCEKLRSCRSVNSSVYTTAAEQSGVRRIHNGIDHLFGDVTHADFNFPHTQSLPSWLAHVPHRCTTDRIPQSNGLLFGSYSEAGTFITVKDPQCGKLPSSLQPLCTLNAVADAKPGRFF